MRFMKHIGAKKIYKDMLINLIGTGIGLAVLQLIIYPLIAKRMNSEAYGQMQAIISIIYMISGTLGSTLSTTRLVREYEYKEKQCIGDYNRFSLVCIGVILVSIPIAMIIYGNGYGFFDMILVILVGFLNFSSNYLSVGFRLKIDFKAIFISRIITTLGYLIGFGLFYIFGKWQFVFITAFFLETIYYILKTDLIHEPYKFTALRKDTRATFFNLGFANVLSRALTYIDKLLLYPLLGGTAVSIYYTANVFGKLILMTIEPITNVILSYLSKEKTVSKGLWKVVVPLSAAVCMILYFFCVIISGPILKAFYPQWAEQATKLIPLTTLCLSVSAFINILYPFTLKIIESSKQIVVNGVSIFVYIVTALLLYKSYSIVGCCWALFASYTVKLAMMFVFCIRRFNRA